MECTGLMVALATVGVNKYPLTVYFENGLVFNSAKNTGVFETDNCLHEADPKYLEYYACAVEISEIVSLPEIVYNEKMGKIEIGNLIELSEINEPSKIRQNDGRIIWQRR
jgi:hypothetical protein